MATPNMSHSETTPVHMANTVSDQDFAIDHGVNDSTRMSDPFAVERTEEIIKKIELGTDLTNDQREQIKSLVREYADVFALSLSEVRVVDWYKHHLDVDPSIKLPTRTSQRPITESQKDWFFSILDEMEDAHVIQKVPGSFIKALSSTNLAPKEAGKIGATRTEILRKVNAECIKNRLPPFWEEVREPGETDEAMLEAVENTEGIEVKSKWRVCHAFTALNKATQIPPFPQGDLKAKQEFAAGHRWASVIDFSAGYYAVPLDDESVPYVAFYVEGRGYYVYLRMPFGLTGAPATFCEMVAIALEDMIGRELVNWMDDICLPGDDFYVKMANLRRFFIRCRDQGLSLSPSKTKLFFTDVLFAGAMVGPNGIKPNLDKVAAVANWPVPQDVQELMRFLGLMNYFRRLICNYARIAQPLSDLTRDISVDLPKHGVKAKKGAYKRALKAASLKDKWGPEQQKAFVTLKVLLSQEPVLKPPQYDGRPFRVTSDGSCTGLAGYLSQQFTYTDKSGTERTRWHPVSYCSKRTSKSEERYEPFLLEFAALKFCLDEFDPYIYGSPIEIETDCQALRDCLLKEKMSTHHSRWKESILAHNIIDIRHRPGVENAVADGLSRMWQNRGRSNTDGSDWSVLADWETTRGIRNDILLVNQSPPPGDTPSLPYELEDHFKGDVFFEPIVRHLLGRNAGSNISERRRAMHRAQGFMIDNGKLWRVSTKANDRVSRTKCIPRKEGFQLALTTHRSIGHFKTVDLLKLHLHERYFWPGMDIDCRQVPLECPECKNFGPTHHNALLQPIRRSRPFSLICGDYLSLPNGHGGFKQVGLYIDVYSGFVWGYKLKSAGTAKSTINSLQRIFHDYATPSTFMADGGSHFNNGDVQSFCSSNGVQHITTAA